VSEKQDGDFVLNSQKNILNMFKTAKNMSAKNAFYMSAICCHCFLVRVLVVVSPIILLATSGSKRSACFIVA